MLILDVVGNPPCLLCDLEHFPRFYFTAFHVIAQEESLKTQRAKGVVKKYWPTTKRSAFSPFFVYFFSPTQNTASRNRRISETIDRRTWPTQRLPCYIIFLFLPHSRRRQRILYIEPRYILSRLRYIFVAHFVWFMASHWSFFFLLTRAPCERSVRTQGSNIW